MATLFFSFKLLTGNRCLVPKGRQSAADVPTTFFIIFLCQPKANVVSALGYTSKLHTQQRPPFNNPMKYFGDFN
jgi:hypothetical protein